jgi:hypothetical protein
MAHRARRGNTILCRLEPDHGPIRASTASDEGEILKDGTPAGDDPVLKLMGRVSLHCNDAEIRQEDGLWKVEGDPIEGERVLGLAWLEEPDIKAGNLGPADLPRNLVVTTR